MGFRRDTKSRRTDRTQDYWRATQLRAPLQGSSGRSVSGAGMRKRAGPAGPQRGNVIDPANKLPALAVGIPAPQLLPPHVQFEDRAVFDASDQEGLTFGEC